MYFVKFTEKHLHNVNIFTTLDWRGFQRVDFVNMLTHLHKFAWHNVVCLKSIKSIHDNFSLGQTIDFKYKEGGEAFMSTEKKVPLMLSVPVEILTMLRTMAAQENLEHPESVTSAAEIAREIIINKLNETQN